MGPPSSQKASVSAPQSLTGSLMAPGGTATLPHRKNLAFTEPWRPEAVHSVLQKVLACGSYAGVNTTQGSTSHAVHSGEKCTGHAERTHTYSHSGDPIFVVISETGGKFYLKQNEFLFRNSML